MRAILKSCLVLSLIFLLISTPILAQNDRAQGLADGERDARSQVNKTTWIIAGCLTGGFSYLYPDLFAYNVPQSRLVGKSPEYIAAFTDSYLDTRKSIIHSGSCIGGVIYWGACIIYVVVVAAAASTSTTSTYY